MTRLFQAAVLLSVLSRAYCQSGDPNAAVVRIAGWTTSGERLEKIWVVVSSLDGQDTYKGNGRDVVLSVPTGEYVLRTEAPGFQSMRQTLKVYQPAVFRSVALPVARLHGQTESSLAGMVRNYGGDVQDLRIRLMALYGDELWECIPDGDGSFRFPASAGAYLLVIVADLKEGISMIHSEPVQILLGKQKNVSVDLRQSHGTVIPRPVP